MKTHLKTHLQKSNRTRGTVLFASLSITGILGFLIGSFLCLIQTQRLSVSRAQSWNSALVVAEAGIEEAMAHLNSGVATNNLSTNLWVSLATNSWTSSTVGVVGKTNYLGTSYYAVSIQTTPAVTNTTPVITAIAYVPAPVSGPTLSRTVRVNTKQQVIGSPSGAIIVKTTIDLAGSGVFVDSFDSSNPLYSTAGQYDPTKNLANGDVITDSSATNALSVGNGTVAGTVHTGPGGVVNVTTGKQGTGSVGDLAWVNSNTGIESGHDLQDANYTFNDVTLPSGVTWSVAQNGAKYSYPTKGGTMFDYTLTSSGTYVVTNLSSAVYVGALGGMPSTGVNVTLYVPNSLTLGTGTEIYIAPGATLTMYVGAANVSIGGQGVVNSGGLASAFHYYGLPSNTSFGLQANASFSGVVDAPEADVSIGGGGSSTYAFVGQIMANSMKLNGHFNFHYDQALGGGQTFGPYVGAFWAEL